MYNYFNNLNYKLNILVIFNIFVYFQIKYDSLDRNTQTKLYLMSIFGYFWYIWVVWIQNTQTELGNTVILGNIIRTCFRYIGYPVIFRFIYIRTELTRTREDPKFVIPERDLISKPKKSDTRKNRSVPG